MHEEMTVRVENITPEQIEAGTRLIADFMGWKYSKKGTTASLCINNKWSPYRLKDIQFATSWDWLMPVVLKIEDTGGSVNIFYRNCQIEWGDDNYEIHEIHESPYTLVFDCPAEDWQAFKDNLVKPEDVIYAHPNYGDLLNKPAGNIYSGGLFVAHLKGIGRSYNIKPAFMPLDRDRCVPQAFDVEYYSSQILQASAVLTVKDLGYSDTKYLTSLPTKMYEDVKPRKVGNNIEFTIKDEAGKDQVITNDHLKEHLKSHSLFAKAIARLKKMLVKHLGVYDLLVAFRDKHVRGTEALQDFEIILNKIDK